MAEPNPVVVEAAQTLLDRGAIFVLMDSKKSKDTDGGPAWWSSGVVSDRDRVITVKKKGTSSGKVKRPHYTAAEAAEWVQRPGRCEVGVLVSTIDDGLVVVDYDKGVESAEALSGLIGEPMVLTKSGSGKGVHAWYRRPPDAEGAFTRKCGVMLPGLVGKREQAKADVTFSHGVSCETGEGLIAVAHAVANTSDNGGRMGRGVWQVLARLADPKDNVRKAMEGIEELVDGSSHNTFGSLLGKAMQGDMGQWGPEGFLARLMSAAAVSRWPDDAKWVKDARRYASDVAGKAKREWDGRFAVFGSGEPVGSSQPPPPNDATTPLARQVLANAQAGKVKRKRTVVPGGLCADGLAVALFHMKIELAVLEDQGGLVGFRPMNSDAWKVMDTTDRTEIMGALQNRYSCEHLDKRSGKTVEVPMKFSLQDFMEHAAEVASGRRVNVLRDFLKDCPTFDDPNEAYRVLQEEFAPRLWRMSGVSEEIARVAFPALLIAAVGRHYEPGAKFDAMTILCSDPGLGKTTFVHNLLPDTLEFSGKVQVGFSYGLKGENEDDKMNKLVGASFVDFSEMSPKGIDLERLKGFVDRRYDTFRRKYGIAPKSHPRTCVLTATSNRPDPLPHDPAGHRKFWIVWLDGMADGCGPNKDTAEFVEEFFAEHRKRLWGAAKVCWFGFARKGSVHPKLVMPRELWGKVTAEAEESSSVPESVREMMDQLAGVPACVDWLMPEELVQMTGRARIVGGDYVPSPDWLLKAARTAVDSTRGWERVHSREVEWKGVLSRPRHFRRVGDGAGGKRHVKDDDALKGRRALLGIKEPGDNGGGDKQYPFEGMGS